MPTEYLSKVLASVPYVTWDRYTADYEGGIYKFYGWIDRAKDAYKDFVLLTYNDLDDKLSFTTSSSKYSKKLCKDLFGTSGDHNDCIRVEKHFDIPNVVRLKK